MKRRLWKKFRLPIHCSNTDVSLNEDRDVIAEFLSRTKVADEPTTSTTVAMCDISPKENAQQPVDTVNTEHADHPESDQNLDNLSGTEIAEETQRPTSPGDCSNNYDVGASTPRHSPLPRRKRPVFRPTTRSTIFFSLNFVFLILGVVLLGFCLLALNGRGFMTILFNTDASVLFRVGGIRALRIAVISLASLGAFTVLTTWAGMWGVLRASTCLLKVYCVNVVIFFAMKAAVLGVVLRHNEAILVFLAGLVLADLVRHYDGYPNALSQFFDFLNIYLGCCGVEGWKDFHNTRWYASRNNTEPWAPFSSPATTRGRGSFPSAAAGCGTPITCCRCCPCRRRWCCVTRSALTGRRPRTTCTPPPRASKSWPAWCGTRPPLSLSCCAVAVVVELLAFDLSLTIIYKIPELRRRMEAAAG